MTYELDFLFDMSWNSPSRNGAIGSTVLGIVIGVGVGATFSSPPLFLLAGGDRPRQHFILRHVATKKKNKHITEIQQTYLQNLTGILKQV